MAMLVNDARYARLLVLGGSSNPDAAELQFKSELIRTLHERQGFNVLVVEGPPWQCSQDVTASVTIETELIRCLGGNEQDAAWQRVARSVLAMRSAEHPLVVVGTGLSAPLREETSRYTYRVLFDRADIASRALAARVDELLESVGHRWDRRERVAGVLQRPDEVAVQTLDSLRRVLEADRDHHAVGTEAWARAALGTASLEWSIRLRRAIPDPHGDLKAAVQFAASQRFRFITDTLFPNQRLLVWTSNDNARRSAIGSELPTWQRPLAAGVIGSETGDRMMTLGVYSAGRDGADASTERPWLATVTAAVTSGSAYLRTWLNNAGWLRRRVPDHRNASIIPSVDFDGVVVLAAESRTRQ
jgi:erythromycin esterase-like protein